MERVIILKNTDTGQALALPVTPQSYPMAEGRAVARTESPQQVGHQYRVSKEAVLKFLGVSAA